MAFNRGPVQKDSFFSAFTVGIKTELYEAGAAIAAGDWVAVNYALDTSLTKVYKADSGVAAQSVVVGVATEAAAAGANVRIQTKGPYATANVANAVNAAGVALIAGSTAGRAVAGAAHTDVACGISLAAASGNVAAVVIL